MDIKNNCDKLPIGALWQLRLCVSWISPADLTNLGSIILEERMVDADSHAPAWHKRATENNLSVNGLYQRKSDDSQATIRLFIRDLYRGIPRLYWLTPIVTISYARTLAHEVGHHLIAMQGYVFVPGEKVVPEEYEEEMAHRYSYELIRRMNRRWYYRLAMWATRDLASWNFIKGILNWRGRRYARAAENWYRAFHLDPDRHDALQWYQEAHRRNAAKIE